MSKSDPYAVLAACHCPACKAEYRLPDGSAATCGKCLERCEVADLIEGAKPPPSPEERLADMAKRLDRWEQRLDDIANELKGLAGYVDAVAKRLDATNADWYSRTGWSIVATADRPTAARRVGGVR